MSDKKSILLVTTQYRVGERIYPIIPKLASEYNLDLLKLYQMSSSWKWSGDNDLRKSFDREYLNYFDKVFTNINLSYDDYNLIITDDNRTYNGLSEIYQRKKCLLLACSHGVTEHKYEIHNVGKSYDGCFVFGKKEVKFEHQIPSGIPANDKLKNYLNVEKEHILIIINYLGHEGQIPTGNGSNFRLFDKEVFDSLNLLELQEKYNKPTVIKIKSRPDTDFQKHLNYLEEILPKELDYKVLLDVEDDNLLIAQSVEVISAPSTLALKPIQLGIPTTLIPGTGQTGIFYDYETNENFIEDTIQGGLEFNSTDYFIGYIKQLLNV
tara:strand:+ start:892 stop:1860 length:969 start_codon:yes stop_codon:yes gene_type:complete